MINRQIATDRIPVKADSLRAYGELADFIKHESIVIYFSVAVKCFFK